MKESQIYSCLFLIVVFLLLSAGWSRADILDDFHNSTMTGYTGGENPSFIVENISIFEPENQSVLGIPLTMARYKILLLNDKQAIDDLMLIGNIGAYDPEKNNTWKLFVRQIDEPFNVGCTGILYDAARHWLGEDAPPVYAGVGIMEGGDMMYSVLGEYEFQPGYFVYADVYMTMEDLLNPNSREGKFGFQHFMDPKGKTYIDVFYYNISSLSYIGAGVGFNLD